MNYISLLLPFILSLQFASLEANSSCESFVLTEDNFDTEVTNNTELTWIVKLYAPWCGHCKRLAPIWVTLAKHFCKHPTIRVGEINGDEEGNIKDRLTHSGFPTIYVIKNGTQAYTFRGRRALEQFKDFAESDNMTNPIEIPPNLGFWGNTWRKTKQVWENLSSAIVQLYQHVGLGWIPHWLMIDLVVLLMISPLFCLIGCIVVMDKMDKKYIEEERRKKAEEDQPVSQDSHSKAN